MPNDRLTFLLFLFSFSPAHADPLVLNLPQDVYVTESVIETGGQKYRRIEYKDHAYTLQLMAPEAIGDQMSLRCNDASREPLSSESLIVISRQVTKRSSVFIEGLRLACVGAGPGDQRKIALEPQLRIGFQLDTEALPGIKNKKVFVAPLTRQLGLSGEW